MDTQELASALRSVVSALHKTLRKQVYSTQSYSLTEMETIGHLMRNDFLLPTELAVLTNVKTQSMSQILKKMEEAGLVKRTASKEDKRKVFISLTALGKKMVEKTRYDRDELLKAMMEKSLTPREKDLLIKALPVLEKLSQSK